MSTNKKKAAKFKVGDGIFTDAHNVKYVQIYYAVLLIEEEGEEVLSKDIGCPPGKKITFKVMVESQAPLSNNHEATVETKYLGIVSEDGHCCLNPTGDTYKGNFISCSVEEAADISRAASRAFVLAHQLMASWDIEEMRSVDGFQGYIQLDDLTPDKGKLGSVRSLHAEGFKPDPNADTIESLIKAFVDIPMEVHRPGIAAARHPTKIDKLEKEHNPFSDRYSKLRDLLSDSDKFLEAYQELASGHQLVVCHILSKTSDNYSEAQIEAMLKDTVDMVVITDFLGKTVEDDEDTATLMDTFDIKERGDSHHIELVGFGGMPFPL